MSKKDSQDPPEEEETVNNAEEENNPNRPRPKGSRYASELGDLSSIDPLALSQIGIPAIKPKEPAEIGGDVDVELTPEDRIWEGSIEIEGLDLPQQGSTDPNDDFYSRPTEEHIQVEGVRNMVVATLEEHADSTTPTKVHVPTPKGEDRTAIHPATQDIPGQYSTTIEAQQIPEQSSTSLFTTNRSLKDEKPDEKPIVPDSQGDIAYENTSDIIKKIQEQSFFGRVGSYLSSKRNHILVTIGVIGIFAACNGLLYKHWNKPQPTPDISQQTETIQTPTKDLESVVSEPEIKIEDEPELEVEEIIKTTYFVQKGDTLSDLIAERTDGESYFSPKSQAIKNFVMRESGVKKEDFIYPKQKLIFPKETIEYKVEKDDTLWSIAEKKLGSGIKFKEIKIDNEVGDPHKLAVGKTLYINLEEEVESKSTASLDNKSFEHYAMAFYSDESNLEDWALKTFEEYRITGKAPEKTAETQKVLEELAIDLIYDKNIIGTQRATHKELEDLIQRPLTNDEKLAIRQEKKDYMQERMFKVKELREQGLTYREIGVQIGRSETTPRRDHNKLEQTVEVEIEEYPQENYTCIAQLEEIN